MNIFDLMVSQYHPQNEMETEAAQREVMQKIVLAGLKRGGFFDHAAFYGGTCLRLFHGLQRFSEDMDFSLTEKDANIHLDHYLPSVADEFQYVGFPVEIVKKEKKTLGRIESAFLKENTEVYDVKFQTRKMMKIKIELDVDPPLKFNTELKALDQPYLFMTRCFTLPDLFAGKMHALVYRAWQHRIKGRDWYDFEWYVRWQVPLDFAHLQERIREFGGKETSKEDFMNDLRERLATSDIRQVKNDVMPFVNDSRGLEHWTNEYFLQLADRLCFVD